MKEESERKSPAVHSLSKAMTLVAQGIHHEHLARGGKSCGLGGKRRQAMKLWRRSKMPLKRSLSILKIQTCTSQIKLRILMLLMMNTERNEKIINEKVRKKIIKREKTTMVRVSHCSVRS